jgi:hypothetical protein
MTARTAGVDLDLQEAWKLQMAESVRPEWTCQAC